MKKSLNKNIKNYVLIYQLVISAIFIATIFIFIKDIKYAVCMSVIVLIINVILSLICNSIINKSLRKNSELQDVTIDISDDIEYNTPLPCLIINEDKNVIWYNNIIIELLGKKEILGKKLTDVLPGFDISLIDNDNAENLIPEYNYENGYYDIKTEMLKKQNKLNDNIETYKVLYLFDITEKINMKEKYEEEKTLFGYVYIDNYEEILNSTEETRRPMMLGIIERKLQTFAKELNGTIKKMEKDRFLLLITKESLEKVIEGKFKILEEIRKINVGNEFPITLSIGFSLMGDSIDALMENSKDAAEIAISRGGNQAVIKKEDNDYEYYGAKAKQEIDGTNASKAKARIKAYALKELIMSVDNVLVMGHKNPDLDAIGSAIGIYRLSRELGKNSHIVLDESNNSIEVLYNKINESDDYEDNVFITSTDALKYNSDDTALIVVDVNIPLLTECPELLDNMDKIAIIDHHIRGTQFIEKAKVIYLDPFASSACEEVVQVAQYIVEKIKFTETEVDAMLAGILVDTKNFMYKTGVKTFEAAAYLKKCGADNIRVKYLFQNDLDSFKKKAEAIKKAEVYKDKIVITICPSKIKNPYTLVAQIADDLLNIIGIEASFVVYDTGEGMCNVSARSNGNVNVQIIMEELGGGGHFTAAGVQIKDMLPKDVVSEIKRCVDLYFEEENEII